MFLSSLSHLIRVPLTSTSIIVMLVVTCISVMIMMFSMSILAFSIRGVSLLSMSRCVCVFFLLCLV